MGHEISDEVAELRKRLDKLLDILSKRVSQTSEKQAPVTFTPLVIRRMRVKNSDDYHFLIFFIILIFSTALNLPIVIFLFFLLY